MTITSDGVVKNLNVVNSPNNNLCRVINKENQKDGEICVKYTGTKFQKLSYLINFLAVIAIGILLISSQKIFRKYKDQN